MPVHTDAVVDGLHLYSLEDLGPADAVGVRSTPAGHDGLRLGRGGRQRIRQADRRHVRHQAGRPVQLEQRQVVAVSLRGELVAGVDDDLAAEESA